MLGTAFSIYDGGLNPAKAAEGGVRQELAAVEYAPDAEDYYGLGVLNDPVL